MTAQPLQRQLLVVLTAALSGALILSQLATAALSPPGLAEVRSARRLAPVLLTSFDATWENPSARDRIVSALSETTGRRVDLVDRTGTIIAAAGPAACPAWDVGALGERGWARMCNHLPAWSEPAFKIAISGLIGALVWLLAALFARRITAPLHSLQRAAERFSADTGHSAGGGASGRGDDVATGRDADHGFAAMPGGDGSLEVASLRTSFKRMAARVRRRVDAQQQLIAILGHELRSPLARIQVHVDLAREDIDRGGQCDAIEREIASLTGLIDDILASARIDFDAVAQTPVDLADAAARAAAARAADGDELTITGQATVNGDPTLLVRLFAIVIDNAYQHGQAPVVITLGSDGAVTVDDAGTGFGAAPERLLAPFERGEHGGLGLGLALAHRIAQAHGGNITLGANPNGGARVTITLAGCT